MAKEATEKSSWQSRFGGGWISAGQWVAESMCDRIARHRKESLPLRFWKQKTWERQFLIQLRHANALLKLYSVKAIVRALRTPQGKKVFSLGAPWLDGLIAEEQRRIDLAGEGRKAAPPPSPPPLIASEQPRPTYAPQKSLKTKLRELDG